MLISLTRPGWLEDTHVQQVGIVGSVDVIVGFEKDFAQSRASHRVECRVEFVESVEILQSLPNSDLI